MAARLPSSSLHELIRRGYFGPVHWAGHELLRRIFVTVRDRHWQEVGPTHWERVIDERARTVALIARHSSELVDFEWQGSLRLSEDPYGLSFSLEGRALRDMDVCRLGLVVLHPLDSLIGSRLQAIGPSGVQRITVARDIAPQPIVNGVPGAITEPFAQLTIERPDFGSLELRFTGDLFELEDQRNWGDASLKTYCTPLREGFPRTIKSGTTVAHTVEVEFEPPFRPTARAVQKATSAPAPQRVPAIGREWCTSSNSVAIEVLPWEHLHFQVTSPDSVGRLKALMEAERAPKFQIDVEADCSAKLFADLVAILAEDRARIARVLLYRAGNALPSARVVEKWCQALGAEGSGFAIPLFAATRGYFVELNRSVPLDLPVTGVAFPLSATVHSDDEETIADNVATICDMAATLRHLMPSAQIALAPLGLYYPLLASPARFPRRLIVPWLTVMIINAAAAQVASITLAEDVLRALAEMSSESRGLLTRLISLAGHCVAPFKGSLSPGVHALMLDPGAQTARWGFAANVTAAAGRVALEGGGIRGGPVSVTDALTGVEFGAVSRDVEIPPFGVVWIEQQ